MTQAKTDKTDGATAKPAAALAALTALGIVYGDLGTSPLYTLQAVAGAVGGHISGTDAIGMLSLIVWALIVTISLKYCLLVMRADNHGEGGILALMSLLGINRRGAKQSRTSHTLVVMALFGAALIYGDGIITPAISVLSALEGVNVASDALKPYVVPVSVLILLVLFASQTLGTGKIGKVFGPVMLIWFILIGILGVLGIAHHPAVLRALDPRHAVAMIIRHRLGGMAILGGVFLATTGGEALYADMGHIGRGPIRASWYFIVLPALLLNYGGQTALFLANPDLTGSPFFLLCPHWAIYPMVALATVATIIASQAIITGSFSLTRQAMQLGWFPGVKIRQTSDEEYGQIYVPLINWLMMAATVALTIGFGSSDRLSGAYGTAVSTTMLLTTALLYTAMRDCWKWPIYAALPISLVFTVVDLAFFSANLLKIGEGGWIPLLVGAMIFVIMTTWRQGVEALRLRLMASLPKPEEFLRRLAEGQIPRVPGSIIFLTRTGSRVPALLVDHVKQFGALQKTVITLTVHFDDIPRIPREERVKVECVAGEFWHVTVRFGFVELPNLRAIRDLAIEQGLTADLSEAIFLGAHDQVIRGKTAPLLSSWRLAIFAFLYRNSLRMDDRFDLPRERFLSIGRHVEV